MTYLLEQMKVEVEAAVSRRKEVDLQMKRLQEKNRALEEKNDEERRKRVETGRVMDFRWRKWIARIAGMASSVRRPRGFASIQGKRVGRCGDEN